MPRPSPPHAKQIPHHVTAHGLTRQDDYAWLKDPRWQEVMQDPTLLQKDIRAYLEAENAYTDAVMRDTDALQKTLFAEMKGRIKEDDSSVPATDGSYAYYTKYRTGGQQPLYCRYPINTPDAEEILLDGDQEAKGKAYYKIGACAHSPNHQLLAFCVDDKGSEFYTLYIRDIKSDALIDTPIPNMTGSVVWSADNTVLFYTTLNENHRPDKVYRHKVGSSTHDDVMIYEETDPGFFLGIDKTESGRFILISAHDHETSEVHILSAETPEAVPHCIEPRTPKLEYDLTDIGETFYILTNADKAEDFKIMTAPVASPSRAHWVDLVPYKHGCLILSLLAFDKRLVRMERDNGLPRIQISQLRSDGTIEDEHAITFDEQAYSLGLSPGYEFQTEDMRFTYSSPTTPTQTFDYNMRTRQRTLRKTQEVPSGHDPSDYVTERITAQAPDGEDVPITLLYRRDLVRDGRTPLLLYGYGSYGYAMPASFSTARLSLVDRGFIYAIAHIRGGMDKGYNWYTDGKREKKSNTFTDFIACAHHLIERGDTSQGHIIAQGGSAGGMLMGAVANMAPELFLGAIAEVPFVDVLNTMSDDTLPLTPPEWPEWGNPIEHAEDYRTIAAYSPYDNVTAQDYPHLLITAGLTDPRVTYWEPAKWTAKLRAMKTDDRLLLLHTNMDAGHAGASGRFDQLKEIALNYAFALKIAEM